MKKEVKRERMGETGTALASIMERNMQIPMMMSVKVPLFVTFQIKRAHVVGISLIYAPKHVH